MNDLKSMGRNCSKVQDSTRLYALSKVRRLARSEDFKRFFDSPNCFRLGAITIFSVPNNLGHFRLGFTLKAKGTSVERSKIKRLVREEMRKVGPSLGAMDYNVVIPGDRLKKKLSREYQSEVKKALAKFCSGIEKK